jgi:hypothetical protein
MLKKTFKLRYLRFVARLNSKRRKYSILRLSEEQKLVYDIAAKLLSSSDSMIEMSPNSGIIFAKNASKVIQIDNHSILFTNDKYSYFFTYDSNLITELRNIFYRHKETTLKRILDKISKETTENLKQIYSELSKEKK